MENGGTLAAIQSMKAHVDSANVQVMYEIIIKIEYLPWNKKLSNSLQPPFLYKQKQACMLLRNLVSRMKNYSQPILELGAEALIAQALQTHQDCGDVGKAALRDLGCKVELQELWTGKHGSLTNWK